MKQEIISRIYKINNGIIPNNYKKDKSSIIPIEWDYKTMRDICNVNQGLQISIHERLREEGNNRYKYLTIQYLNDTTNKDYLYYIENPKESVLCNKDDILMTRTGNTGMVINNVEGVFHNNFFKINYNKSIIYKDYLVYFLKSHRIQNLIKALAGTTTIPDLKHDDFYNVPILIPNLKEQKRIANILSTWDNAIELKEKLIELKKQQKRGLMQLLLTGKKRLKGFIGEWEKVKLGDYLIKHDEKSDYNNQYPVLTSSRLGIFLQKDYFDGKDVASKDNTGYNVVPKGYFTYRHMSDDLIFKFNINTIVEKGIVSTLYPVFTTNSDINDYFLLIVLNEGIEFKKFALKQKQGGSRTYMYFSKLQNLRIKLPKLEEQNAIANILSTADKEIQLLEKQLEQLKQQKKGLMQLLLTGIVRVTD